jgi:dienelactone hydrolase
VRSRSRDVTFQSEAGATLTGTFTTPLGAGPFPVIVLFAGSNEQTRDGQYGILGFAADEFLRLGIAVFAYDKRGFAESTGERTDAFAARDGIAALKIVRTFPEVDQRRVGLWGISQGGMIEPAIARADGNIAFIINVSGSMAAGNVQEVERTERQMRADGFSEPDIADAVAFQRLKFHYAETGRDWDAYAAAYRKYEHAAWFPDPYVGPPESRDSRAWTFWREQGTVAPADEWSSYHGRIIYVQAALETLSDRDEAAALFRAAMVRAQNTSYTVQVIPRAEHTMFLARTGGEREDRYLSTVAPEYFTTMTRWLRAIGVVAGRN